MGEEKPETLDFVKDFQEYLSQQTQHVNMISGSVSGVKEVDDHPAGNCKRPCFVFDLLFPYHVLSGSHGVPTPPTCLSATVPRVGRRGSWLAQGETVLDA